MAEWRVTWVIDVEADSPRDAARQARDAVTRAGTIATVYSVQMRGAETGMPEGEPVEVDLLDID